MAGRGSHQSHDVEPARGLVHEANLARAATLLEVPAGRRVPLVAEYRAAVRVGLAAVPPAAKGRR